MNNHEDNKTKNKRIAKNTLLLYVRMIFLMFVSLFTSRVVLNVLGIENYGIYNVVAGFVAMFSFFTGSLSVAISRFITFELGKGDIEKLKKIFCTSVNVLILMSAIILLLAETGGIWFLNARLNVPAERLTAANWVFQFSILGFILNLISVPYQSAILAHERMGAFAYISILEALLKLLVAYMIYISPLDKLITYSFLLMMSNVVIRFVYSIYCNRQFFECKYRRIFDKQLMKEMASFAGWNIAGSGVYLFNTQGVNIITNLYFGVMFNAARGVATQVESVIRQFVNNFTSAINPQITKSYAEGNMDYLYTLICRGAKYSYLLMLFFAIPFIYETDIILSVWLKNVPEYSVLFFRLTIMGSLIDILGNSMAIASWATGNIKKYYIIIGPLLATIFLISWLLFELGFPAYTSYVVFAAAYLVSLFVKLRLVKGLVGFPVKMYIQQTLYRIIPVTVLCFLVASIPWFLCSNVFIQAVCVFVCSSLSMIVFTYLLGLEKSEKELVSRKVKTLFKKICKSLLASKVTEG